MPSPVLKLAWHLRHTYIFELDIIGFTPGSPEGRAATYSACVWRSFNEALDGAADAGETLAGLVTAGAAGSLEDETGRRVAMAILKR